MFEEDLCIFHCEKTSWYTMKNKIKYWNDDLLNLFWDKFYQILNTQKDYTKFIFPEADYYFYYDEEENPIHFQKLSSLTFEKVDFNDSIFLTNVIFNECKFNKCNFRRVHADNITFLSSEVLECNFQGIPVKSLEFLDCVIEKTNLKWLSLNEMLFESCRLSETLFNNSYIENFDLSASILKDCSFQNTDIERGSIETYRVLKHYNENIKNDILSNQYYSKEMRLYCKDVIFGPYYSFKAGITNIRVTFDNHSLSHLKASRIKETIFYVYEDLKIFFSEGPILLWNFLISDFGQSWYLPLFWFAITSVIIFNYVAGQIPFDINTFAVFINPFLTNLSTETYKNHYALWLLHKILETIFLYHFVIAVKQKTRRIG